MDTLTDWMKGGQDAATCLSAAGAAPLSYAGLRQLSKEVQHAMNAVGIGRNDRVALVLPNSAEMAASFITVAACCTSAPLNPSYRADEFEFYLNDLNAKALVVEAGSSSASIEVAHKLGVSVLVCTPLLPKAQVHSRLIPHRVQPHQHPTQVLHTLTTLLWCCTPPAPRPVPKSCH